MTYEPSTNWFTSNSRQHFDWSIMTHTETILFWVYAIANQFSFQEFGGLIPRLNFWQFWDKKNYVFIHLLSYQQKLLILFFFVERLHFRRNLIHFFGCQRLRRQRHLCLNQTLYFPFLMNKPVPIIPYSFTKTRLPRSATNGTLGWISHISVNPLLKACSDLCNLLRKKQ